MSKVEKFKKELLKKNAKNLQTRFFKGDKNLKFIILFIAGNVNNKITPFRNKTCKFPQCVYDLDELIEEFESADFSKNHTFDCKICSMKVKIQDLQYDETFAKNVDNLWKQYNSSELKVNFVQQSSNGTVALLDEDAYIGFLFIVSTGS